MNFFCSALLQINPWPTVEYYKSLAEDFSRFYSGDEMLLPPVETEFQAPLPHPLRRAIAIARVISTKVAMLEELRMAYNLRDREVLEHISGRKAGKSSSSGRNGVGISSKSSTDPRYNKIPTIPFLRELIQELVDAHRLEWFYHYKPFGWEHIEARYGTLDARLGK